MSDGTSQVTIVSGLSGSGKTVALHTLEDHGTFCVDNLPATLVPAFGEYLRGIGSAQAPHYAVGVDARNPMHQLEAFPDLAADLEARLGTRPRLLFLTADDETLIKRFSETRRRHPLSDGDRPLAEAIRHERELLEPIRSRADLVIDTTATTLHQLRELVRQRLVGRSRRLSLLFESFGFKHGVPSDADFVFDLRMLPNPHWEPELRAQTGRDHGVIAYLGTQADVTALQEDIRALLARWIPAFERDSRSYLTVALGCTGGQHRSVYMAERLAEAFHGEAVDVAVRHRELP